MCGCDRPYGYSFYRRDSLTQHTIVLPVSCHECSLNDRVLREFRHNDNAPVVVFLGFIFFI